MDKSPDLRERFAAIVGPAGVVDDEHQVRDLVTDKRRRYLGRPLIVVQPASTSEVAAIVTLAAQTSTAIIPQGGNTGLCAGATPDPGGQQVVLNLSRMRQIKNVDAVNNTMTVDAGCVLADVQEAASQADRLFPLSLAAEGSCTIGGNISTNAGGVHVLRYGMMRDLVLGVEVVLPSGETWDGLRGLRKDNTGYDLKQVFIGAEGTLGVITVAVLKLFPRPANIRTVLAAVTTTEQAVQLLSLARSRWGERLAAFESYSAACLELVRKKFPSVPAPFPTQYPHYVLADLWDSGSDVELDELLTQTLTEANDAGLIKDAVIATARRQSTALWQTREYISEAKALDGKSVTHDISMPISNLNAFVDATDTAIHESYPDVRIMCFGHLGDGSLHYDIAAPENSDSDAFVAAHTEPINDIVYDSVHRFGGSISAEHGVGQAKREHLVQYASPIEIQLMRTIKEAIDPLGIMNPGKVIAHSPKVG
jgi:D-lactate dehydrogenase (cytochrome)